MAGLFDDVQTDDSIVEDKDTLGGGFGPVDSGLYDLTIKYAYGHVSPNGAKAVSFVFKTEDGKEVKDTQYITSGTKKGVKNFYLDKDGKKNYLPGFSKVNSLCLLTAGKNISALTTEPNTIMLYNFDAKGDVATEVEMITDLVGKTITAGIIKQTEDKVKKNDQSGAYEATGETREVNEMDKYFRHSDGLTVTEIKAKSSEPVFKEKWSDKWTGQSRDKSTGTATAGTPGAPNAYGADAPKENLFG
ncbi:MAG: hypothetical protein PF440_07505 [Thiomicrorhabdus sp.]|nr:hypothetical protein [Thiomicrorhabdus sp.]